MRDIRELTSPPAIAIPEARSRSPGRPSSTERRHARETPAARAAHRPAGSAGNGFGQSRHVASGVKLALDASASSIVNGANRSGRFDGRSISRGRAACAARRRSH